MRVEPELPYHPKYLLLKKLVGDFAMEALIRLWGHCQSSQRGERWSNVNSHYVETVAGWPGKSGQLFAALRKCGWIEKAVGAIIIHDWDEFNSKAKANWKNGKLGGRPSVSAGLTQPEPNQNPTSTSSDLGKPNPEFGKPTANLRVSEYESESGSKVQQEKKNGHLDASAVKASAIIFAALSSQLKEAEAVPVQERSAEMRLEIKKMRAALEDHQKKQAEGKF